MKAEQCRLALAEALLRTVTSAEQAASIAGDLLETARAQRSSFVRDVASTVTWLAGQALCAHPARSLRTLIGSVLLWCLCYLGVRLAMVWPGWLAISVPLGDCLLSGGMHGMLLAGALTLAGLLTGTALGGLWHRGGASPALPLAAAFLAAGPSLAAAELLAGGELSLHCLLTYFVLVPLCYALPVLCGAALGRNVAQYLRA